MTPVSPRFFRSPAVRVASHRVCRPPGHERFPFLRTVPQYSVLRSIIRIPSLRTVSRHSRSVPGGHTHEQAGGSRCLQGQRGQKRTAGEKGREDKGDRIRSSSLSNDEGGIVLRESLTRTGRCGFHPLVLGRLPFESRNTTTRFFAAPHGVALSSSSSGIRLTYLLSHPGYGPDCPPAS